MRSMFYFLSPFAPCSDDLELLLDSVLIKRMILSIIFQNFKVQRVRDLYTNIRDKEIDRINNVLT